MPTPAVSICTPSLCASAEELSNWLLSAAMPARETRSQGLFFTACHARMLPTTECVATIWLFPPVARRDSATLQDLRRALEHFKVLPQLIFTVKAHWDL